MAKVSVKREFDHPVEKVWGLVSDFGDISWMPAGTECRLEGEGPGMIRHIAVGNATLPETLESVDDATRTLIYTIPGELPFPASNYRSTMVVREVVRERGPGSELEWSCTFDPKGDPAQSQATMEGLYGTLIGWVSDALDK